MRHILALLFLVGVARIMVNGLEHDIDEIDDNDDDFSYIDVFNIDAAETDELRQLGGPRRRRQYVKMLQGYMIEMKNIEHCWKMHDECNHMVPQESRHGITNEFPHQVWHCNCALEFYLCLHHINSTLSGRIGELFFTANAKCYRYNYQAIECLIYDEDQRAPQSKRCVQYLLDLDQPSKMQWFDLPFYSGKPPQGPMFTSLKTSKSL